MRYLLACLLVAPAVARADHAPPAPRVISIDDAVRIAVAASPGLIATRVDVEIAHERARAARGALDWVLATRATADRSVDRTADRTADRMIGMTDRLADRATGSVSLTTSTSITRPLADGGSLGVRGETTFARSAGDAESAELRVFADLPLLRRSAASPRGDLVRSEAARNTAALEAEAAAATQIRDLVIAYAETSFAVEELAIRKNLLVLAREQLRVTQARVASGKISGSDAFAVAQAIALREDDVAQAETAVARRGAELAQRVGVAEVAAAPLVPPRVVPRDLEAQVARTLAHNPALAALRARGHAASIEVELADNAAAPRLDLEVSGGLRGEGRRSGAVWDALAQRDTAVYGAELRFAVPLGRNTAATRRVARAGVRRAKLDQRGLELQLRQAVAAEVAAIGAAGRRVQALREATQLGDQALAAERTRWEEGRSTALEVVRRQAERADGQLRLARAVADFVIAEVALDALTGEILPRFHVALAR